MEDRENRTKIAFIGFDPQFVSICEGCRFILRRIKAYDTVKVRYFFSVGFGDCLEEWHTRHPAILNPRRCGTKSSKVRETSFRRIERVRVLYDCPNDVVCMKNKNSS